MTNLRAWETRLGCLDMVIMRSTRSKSLPPSPSMSSSPLDVRGCEEEGGGRKGEGEEGEKGRRGRRGGGEEEGRRGGGEKGRMGGGEGEGGRRGEQYFSYHNLNSLENHTHLRSIVDDFEIVSNMVHVQFSHI